MTHWYWLQYLLGLPLINTFFSSVFHMSFYWITLTKSHSFLLIIHMNNNSLFLQWNTSICSLLRRSIWILNLFPFVIHHLWTDTVFFPTCLFHLLWAIWEGLSNVHHSSSSSSDYWFHNGDLITIARQKRPYNWCIDSH